jgi:hypothetical protein
MQAEMEHRFSDALKKSTMSALIWDQLLCWGCAGNCGYHVVPVQEILMAGRAKYQELLCASLAAALVAQA